MSGRLGNKTKTLISLCEKEGDKIGRCGNANILLSASQPKNIGDNLTAKKKEPKTKKMRIESRTPITAGSSSTLCCTGGTCSSTAKSLTSEARKMI
jgi:hypothetical protein